MRAPIRRIGVITGAVLAVLAVAGCQQPNLAGGDPSSTPPAATSPTVTAPPAANTTAPSLPKATTSWLMPNLVGTQLQNAQDDIQKLTHDVIFFTTSHDATGQGRHQVLDKDWKVCTQSVPAGHSITLGTKIDFGVAKLAEACP
jgi:hypothetical protein